MKKIRFILTTVVSLLYVIAVFCTMWIVFYSPALLGNYYYSGTLILFIGINMATTSWAIVHLFHAHGLRRNSNKSHKVIMSIIFSIIILQGLFVVFSFPKLKKMKEKNPKKSLLTKMTLTSKYYNFGKSRKAA